MWDLIVLVPDHCLSFYLLATYQLSRRLNMISLPSRNLLGMSLPENLVTPTTNGGKNVNNFFFLKTKANYTKFQQPTTNRCWFELV